MSQPKPRPNSNPHIADQVCEDIQARKALGIERYGTPLQACNGRDALLDAYEEALDLAQYLRQAIEERKRQVRQEGIKMAKAYVMKDLGYERTPTEAKLHVQMPDGSWWSVPVQAIADSRDEHYRDDEEDTIGLIRSGGLDGYEIKGWAWNNMNWDEFEAFAERVESPPPFDFQEGWVTGEKVIKGAL